jgi:hypothetical protein
MLSVWVCSVLRFWRGTTLVTTVQFLTACFQLNPLPSNGGVASRWVCLFVWGRVRFDALCTNASSYMTE